MAARATVVADTGTLALIDRLADCETPATLSGHDSPAFAPNLLHLLARMGVRGGDHPAIDLVLDVMLDHTDDDGRFAANAVSRSAPSGAWGTLLCDTHAICEALVRYGRAKEPPVREALARMALDLAPTSQGIAWPCIPSVGFRGPGRRSITELAACLVAYNLDTDGRVTPQSCYRGFEGYSFGQKKVPSPFATAWVRATLRPFDDLADEIAEVEVLTP